jgi:hypothetical protein
MTDGWLAGDVARASATVNAWRAQHLIEQAKRLEIRAAKILAEAKEYRDLAAKLNPTW